MITEIIDWTGTVMVLIAAFVFAMKKAYKPKLRLIGFSFFLLSNCVWIPLGIILQTWGFLLTQIVLVVINIKGVVNCWKEIKELELNFD
jgi:hypothetical protein